MMDILGSQSVVIVMTKTPTAGRSKTRLIPSIGAQLAADLSTCLLLDVVNCISDAGVPVAVCADDLTPSLAALENEKIAVWQQSDGNLGDRMTDACRQANRAGAKYIVLVGTDCPGLPAAVVQSTLDSLTANEHDWVFGPAYDGGFYLVGLNGDVGSAFNNIPWSTDKTLASLETKLIMNGDRLAYLDTRDDVDEPADLVRLWKRSESDSQFPICAPRTARWLLDHQTLLFDIAANIDISLL